MKHELVTIERKVLKFWKGQYAPYRIVLRQGMTREEENKTLAHELLHHDFYVKHKWLRPWFHPRFRLLYSIATMTTWLFSPLLYFILLTPLLALNLQEVYVSAETRCWFRASHSMIVFYILVALGGLRLWIR